MKRKVFYSCHHQVDSERALKVRQLPALEGNQPESDAIWQTIVSEGQESIEQWIDQQLQGRSCMVVLIGSETAHRKWVKYEIQRAWDCGKGLLGIYIHHLEDDSGIQSFKGQNPFGAFTIRQDGRRLSDVVRAYDPPFAESDEVRDYIAQHLGGWVEEAVCIRDNYRRLRA